jgi:uncharacterized protein with gpF-like domain
MVKNAKPKLLKPVRPSAAIDAWYKRKLDQMIDEMNASIAFWLERSYASRQDQIVAMDELPAKQLSRALNKLRRRWQKNFDEAAPKLAKYFTQQVDDRSKKQLQDILKEAGFSVEFTMTSKQADGIRANITENVSLIRSIPQKHFTDIEGMVMRSVQAGRDLHTLSKQLEKQYGKTKKRAALIARDQNNKATAFLTRTRQGELGVKKAIWVHSHAGKVPRPTHLANDGNAYDITKGWYDPDANGKGNGAYIFPGELINCRCISRSIIPGFS